MAPTTKLVFVFHCWIYSDSLVVYSWLCVSQLWFSNGPGLLVIDTTSLQAVRRLEPYKTPSSIVSMTTSFSLCGEEGVWTLDDHSNTIMLYYAASYELCATYW